MDTWTLFAMLKVMMMSVNTWKYIQIHIYFMVFGVLQNLSLPETNYLSPSTKTSVCWRFCSVFPLFIFFSLYGDFQPGVHNSRHPSGDAIRPSSGQRHVQGTACNCLSHHLQKKTRSWKATASVTTLTLVERKTVVGGGGEPFLFVPLFILFPLDASETQ